MGDLQRNSLEQLTKTRAIRECASCRAVAKLTHLSPGLDFLHIPVYTRSISSIYFECGNVKE